MGFFRQTRTAFVHVCGRDADTGIVSCLSSNCVPSLSALDVYLSVQMGAIDKQTCSLMDEVFELLSCDELKVVSRAKAAPRAAGA